MGSYNSLYVGVYLEVEGGTEMVTETRLVNPNTGAPMMSKFDPNSGVEAIEEKLSTRKQIHASPYIQEEGYCKDEFWSPAHTGAANGKETFILNSHNKYAKVYDGVCNIDIHESTDIENLLLHFNRDYKKYLDYYRNLYKFVEVKYGVVYYAH